MVPVTPNYFREVFPNMFVGYENDPSAIVAIIAGEPIILLVSPVTLINFQIAQKKAGLTHIELASLLYKRITRAGGQFHENSVSASLRSFLVYGNKL